MAKAMHLSETLFALGLDEEIVGVSHECDFPPEAKTRKSVVRSRLPKDATPAEIDRLVREHVERGEMPLVPCHGPRVL